MTWILNNPYSKLRKGSLVFLLLCGCLFTSCKISNTSTSPDTSTTSSIVYIYNLDEDHTYRVELYLKSDQSLVASYTLNKNPANDSTYSFEDVAEGIYYISIFQDAGSVATDKSGNFYLEGDDYACFKIEADDGDLQNCF
jgi:hypothetical protein